MMSSSNDSEEQLEDGTQQHESSTSQNACKRTTLSSNKREEALPSATKGSYADAEDIPSELLEVIHALQTAPQLQVDTEFAKQLEQHLLARKARLKQVPPRSSWWPLFSHHSLRVHPLVGVTAMFLLLLSLGTGVLIAAAHTTNPTSPLYSLKRWEYQVQAPLTRTSAPVAQAQWDAQFSQDQLSVLTAFARDGQSPPSVAYRKALVAFDQAIQALTHDIDQLPQGKERQQLEHQRLEQTVQAQKAFYNLLWRLTMGDRQQTTVVLGHLGAQVPHLTRVRIALPPKGMPPGKAELTITLTGDHFQPGAQLLINNRVMSIPGTLQRGVYVFVLIWNGPQVQSVGLLSRDGTVVQTTSLEENQHGSSATSQDNRNHSNGQGDGNGNNTSGGNKNTGKGNAENHGNGNDGGKRSVTPTPPIHH